MFNMAFLTLVNTLFCLAKYALNPHTHPNIRLDILHGHVTMYQACVIQNCIAKMLDGKKLPCYAMNVVLGKFSKFLFSKVCHALPYYAICIFYFVCMYIV